MGDFDILHAAAQGSGVGVWALVLMALITLIKGWPTLKKLSIEADGSLRKDLLNRINELEDELRKEKRERTDDVRAERIRCDGEMDKLHNEITGLQRHLITFQIASGRPMALHTPEADAAVDSLLKILNGTPGRDGADTERDS